MTEARASGLSGSDPRVEPRKRNASRFSVKESMARFKHPLDRVRVASPCKADWDQMIGSGRMRFCGQCNLNVYNLSGMTRDEAESLIARHEGRLCIRFYRRHDGSIITQDCPVGLRAVRETVSYWTRAIGAAALTFLAAAGLSRWMPVFTSPVPQRTMGVMMRTEKVSTIQNEMIDERVHAVAWVI